MWYVYIIQADDKSLYTGITTNVEKRFQAHLNKKGAKYFYARKPVKVCYIEECKNKSLASKREYAIKKLTRTEKLTLISEYTNSNNAQ